MKKVFAIRDLKAQCFYAPFCDDSTVNALRGFEIGVNDSKSMFNKFPDDFALCEFGTFDPVKGFFAIGETWTELARGSDVIHRSSPVSEVR